MIIRSRHSSVILYLLFVSNGTGNSNDTIYSFALFDMISPQNWRVQMKVDWARPKVNNVSSQCITTFRTFKFDINLLQPLFLGNAGSLFILIAILLILSGQLLPSTFPPLAQLFYWLSIGLKSLTSSQLYSKLSYIQLEKFFFFFFFFFCNLYWMALLFVHFI